MKRKLFGLFLSMARRRVLNLSQEPSNTLTHKPAYQQAKKIPVKGISRSERLNIINTT